MTPKVIFHLEGLFFSILQQIDNFEAVLFSLTEFTHSCLSREVDIKTQTSILITSMHDDILIFWIISNLCLFHQGKNLINAS